MPRPTAAAVRSAACRAALFALAGLALAGIALGDAGGAAGATQLPDDPASPLPAAAAGSDATAQAAYRRGETLAQGLGVPRDPAGALAAYCRADRAGHAGAAYRIGWMVLNGEGTAADADEAAAWLQRAAAAGSRPAAGALKLIPSAAPGRRTVCRQPLGVPSARLAAIVARAPASIRDLVGEIAPRHGLDPALVFAVIAIESAFDADAVSPKQAQGLMQLMPATARRFAVADVFDPQQNIDGGVRYLAELVALFDADLDKVLAAYNAGEGAVTRHGGIPPYDETRDYVRKVRALYR